MSSIHAQHNANNTVYRVLWRQDGRQRSLTFADKRGAERFKDNLDSYGQDEALRIVESEESHRSVPTVAEWITQHIDSLTGVERGTITRYKRYLSRDITPVMGQLPLTAVTEHTIAKWVQQLEAEGNGNAGKTVQNKHGFLSAALNAAVRQGHINSNPCDGRRLPHTKGDEMVFLTPSEFQLLRDCIPRARYRDLASWLVLTGMRFGEATALTPNDIDPIHRTCRINKAVKFTGEYAGKIGPPKTRKSDRVISLPENALAVIDLTQPEWLFTNGVGNRVTSQEFYNAAWKPAREKAREKGLKKWPRVHDLRHTYASWAVAAGVPLPVLQAHLGHESIKTTVDRYSHVDRRSGDAAAAIIDTVFNSAAIEVLPQTEIGV